MKEVPSKTPEDFDVVIIGGGITGTVASIFLQRSGLKVLMAERSDLSDLKPGESLSPECKRFFNRLGLAVDNAIAIEYSGISSIWESDLPIDYDFIYNPFGNGLAIDRAGFERKLVECAEKEGVRVFLRTRIDNIHRRNGNWVIKMTGDRNLSSKFVIFATGRSTFRFDPLRRRYFDKLIALSKIVDWNSGNGVNNIRIEALPDGWFYTNRLPKNKRVITIFTDSDLIPGPPGREALFWKNVAGTAWFEENRLDPPHESGALYAFDARTSMTLPHCGEGWLCLGDSAYSIDPLSGQGIRKNLEMIEFLQHMIGPLMTCDKKAPESFMAFNIKNFDGYTRQRKKVYATNSKWRTREFWKRRAGG